MSLRTFLASLRLLLVAVAGVALSSCAATGPLSSMKNPLRAEQVLYEWYDDGGPGEVNIRINLTEQRATYYRGRREIGWSFVATGKENHNTAPGKFKITEKIEDKHSNSYGWIEDEAGNVTNGDAKPSTPVPPGEHYVAAPMPYWMRLTSYGVGMHAGIIPRPGEPASHGCIRLPKPLAPQVFEVVKVGTPVEIIY